MAIEPLSIPSAAGVNYGEGDVRHFAEGDGVSVPALSNPTRHLAARDSAVALKVNELVTEVNNKEQIVSIPVPRTVMPGNAEEIIANFRIPDSYEARVLNAVISSSPLSSSVELNVMWAQGYGNVTGDSVLTTAGESNGGTKFNPAGEFIIEIKNKGDVTLEIVANVTLTMRPVSTTASALLPSPSQAPPGPPGLKGDKGGKGDGGGAGPPGSPGLVFRGRWTKDTFPVNYVANDVVTHDFSGTSGISSYVCSLGHIAAIVNQPQPSLIPSPFWDFLSQAGATGGTGSQGNAQFPVFDVNGLTTSGTTSSNYAIAPDDGDDNYSRTDLPLAGTVVRNIFQWNEFTVQGGTEALNGLAFLRMSERRTFHGTIGYALPSQADGAVGQWTTDNVTCVASIHGTINSADAIFNNGTTSGTFASLCTVVPVSPRFYRVSVQSQAPEKIGISFEGITVLNP